MPNEYFANYQIQKEWKRLSELFIEIDADSRIGKIWWSTLYGELYAIMNKIFPFFPQDYTFQVVYKQCLKTTKEMQNNPNRENYNSFYENCQNPLSSITATINSQYTVKASATLNPSSGPAPLTVTFDARASSDPSNETLPSRNFFWYYRDIDGTDRPIGYWPVVNYKFQESWTYQVHLTVRSSNKGIFDGEATVSVNVSPKSANVIVYANGKKMDKNKPVKVGVQEAKKGVVFDGSATLPMGGREILSYQWDISSRDGFKRTKEGDWKPGYINVPLPSQWEFIVNLSVSDNERNLISERYTLSVSDPVAIVQQAPEKGMTSTTYSFSAAASYSLSSRLKLYTREIFDSEGAKLDTLQGKEIKKQFKKPGNYTVKLTVEDEIGGKNIDTINVYVESTPPQPQFTITPTSTRQYPSEFTLDAQSSNDIDVANGYDSLSYDWKFSNQNAVHITSTDQTNKKITALFNEIWTHQVTLTVSDKYGKISEITKDIIVESILRPILTIRPKASVWKTYVTFSLKSNLEVLQYERDFGDGSVARVNRNNVMRHEYQRVGAYKVTVKATDENGTTNTVYDTVYIGEKDSPIAAYEIHNEYGTKLAENDKCETENGQQHNAYRVDRHQRFNINTSASVNAQGTPNQLRYYFQAKNDEIITSQHFSYKFNSLGCQYIDYTLEDSSLGKTVKERIWFKVVNAIPKLDNLSISFPQYGNEIWIWFQQGNKTQDIFNSGVDPIIIKVNADNAYDSDGSISYFKRYYYPKDNPNKIIATKISPGTIPYTFFSVPKQPGEFMFGVKMFDNDNGTQTSEEIIGNGPIVIFPNQWGQPDIPIVTLKSDKINAEVGEEITFDIISKILSDRSDFVKERTIQLDFDWDGTIDLTTKDDRVKYTYTKPSGKNPYTPVAKVLYRDYIGQWEGAEILIKYWIKPALIGTTLWTTAFFKDVSIGTLIEREICRDIVQCDKGNTRYIDTEVAEQVGGVYQPLTKKTFKVHYPAPGKYTVRIKAKDSNGNEAINTLEIEISEKSDSTTIGSWLEIISLPKIEQSEKWHLEVFVGKQLNNEVMLYIKTASNNDKCRLDSDIAKDKNFDGKADNDVEFGCNRILNITYIPTTESSIGRIFYQADGTGKILQKDFTVTFAHYENSFLSDELKNQYTAITELLNTIDDSSSVANADLKIMLTSLRNDLVDINTTRANVIQIEDLLSKKTVKLSSKQEEKLNWILIALSDHATLSAKGASSYEVAKSEILALLPLALQQEANKHFTNFDHAEQLAHSGLDVKTIREWALQSIYTTIADNAVNPSNIWANQIGTDDFKAVVEPHLCNIAKDYSISAQYCSDAYQGDDSTKVIPTIASTTTTTSSTFPVWLKVVLWILGIVVVGFIGVVVAFAIKAKLREKYDEE